MNAKVEAMLLFWLCFTGVWAAVRFGFFPLFVAQYRHDLFSVRRSLFLLVASGAIEPEALAYVRLRGRVNSMLASAEHMTFLHLIVMSMAMRRMRTEDLRLLQVPVDEAIAKVESAELRRELLRQNSLIAKAMNRHLLRLVLLTPWFWPFFIVALVRRTTGKFITSMSAFGASNEREPLHAV